MTAHYEDATITVYGGDCLDVLRELPDASVDAVVCDPPYGLASTSTDQVITALTRWINGERDYIPTGKGFMGKAWDAFVPPPAVWDDCFRVLKPGGHMLVFAGTRTAGLMDISIRLAGFETRDNIAWLYGSGFPKSLDVSKAIDKAAGADREVVGDGAFAARRPRPTRETNTPGAEYGFDAGHTITAPATDDARTWQGWGTALKPAHEPIVVARKPLTGTVAANVLTHGTGALNIDACRISTDEDRSRPPRTPNAILGNGKGTNLTASESNPAGRWPANVVLDEDQAAALDTMSGELHSQDPRTRGRGNTDRPGGMFGEPDPYAGYADTGGASRFFYTAKADAAERVRLEGVAHPTVKPLSLMRWLVRLVTPPGGVVLEPFAGSGTTVEACILEGFRCVAIEREPDYLPLILQRIHRRRDPVQAVRATGDDGGLFDLLEVERVEPNPDTRAGEATADKRYTSEGGTNFAMKPGRRYKDERAS